MKWIKLYGYFARNLGDDLMVQLLRQRYPDVRFYSETWTEVPGIVTWETLQRKHGRLNHLLNLLTRYRWKDFYMHTIRKRYDRKCSCSVYIGGSIYMQRTALEEQLRQEERKLQNGPLFVIGANFGPSREEAFAEGFADYFCRCAGVTFRDKSSYERFRGCGNVAYAPDVVLNFQAAPQKNNGTVLISVINLENRPDLMPWRSDYETWMAALCETCIRMGKRPVLLSHCQAEGDEAAIARILEALSPEIREKTGTLCYRGDGAEILDAYAGADRVIATRFHAMILAMCFQKPFFAIAYSEKCRHYLEDLDFGGFCGIPQLIASSPTEILDRCGLPETVNIQKRAAKKQFA
jgi:colanic acid/amylovoran biosynthesis protein